MRIVFTGGGSGGHFYPIIAVAEAIQKIAREQKLLEPELYFAGPNPYDKKLLLERQITYVRITAGKRRNYSSILNFIDFFKIGFGALEALWRLLWIYPDVVFGKGGYGSFPTLFAARLLRIPVIIHESDTIPGRVSQWAARFAKRIALAFPEALEKFDEKDRDKIAVVGNPIREGVSTVAPEGAREFLKLEPQIETVLVLGGSQGAQAINEAVLEALPELVEQYTIIHQTGRKNFDEISATAKVILEKNQYKERYKPFDYLDVLALRMSAGAADIVISRAGSGGIFEIAIWGKPSIIIPIPQNVARDQRTNAFAYARTGAAIVIEQENLSPHVLLSEIDRIMNNADLRAKMSTSAKGFARPNADEQIAKEILTIALEHEK